MTLPLLNAIAETLALKRGATLTAQLRGDAQTTQTLWTLMSRPSITLQIQVSKTTLCVRYSSHQSRISLKTTALVSVSYPSSKLTCQS